MKNELEVRETRLSNFDGITKLSILAVKKIKSGASLKENADKWGICWWKEKTLPFTLIHLEYSDENSNTLNSGGFIVMESAQLSQMKWFFCSYRKMMYCWPKKSRCWRHCNQYDSELGPSFSHFESTLFLAQKMSGILIGTLKKCFYRWRKWFPYHTIKIRFEIWIHVCTFQNLFY